MSKRRTSYTKAFKEKAVELSYVNGNIKQTCKDLDISISSLSRWRVELKQYGKNSFPGKGNLKLTD
jgi:transposase